MMMDTANALGDLTVLPVRESADFLKEKTGMTLPDTQIRTVEIFLKERLSKTKLDVFHYINKLRHDPEEQSLFISAVTINETYFFREEAQFRGLENYHFIEIQKRAICENRPVKIWSACCSSGEEPLSLYFLLKSRYPSLKFEIYASDISPHAIDQFKKGCYRKNSFKEDGRFYHDLVKKYSSQSESVRIVDPGIIEKINISRINLFDEREFPSVMFDMIFIRNCLIYFSEKERERVLDYALSRLLPGGYFFTSTTETAMIDHPELKNSCVFDKVYYFTKKGEA